MMMTLRQIALIVLLILAPAAGAGLPQQGIDLAAVDQFVARYLERTGIPGAAIALVQGDEVLALNGYGHDAAGNPMTAHSQVRIASLSKSFTALYQIN